MSKFGNSIFGTRDDQFGALDMKVNQVAYREAERGSNPGGYDHPALPPDRHCGIHGYTVTQIAK